MLSKPFFFRYFVFLNDPYFQRMKEKQLDDIYSDNKSKLISYCKQNILDALWWNSEWNIKISTKRRIRKKKNKNTTNIIEIETHRIL